MTPEAMHIQVKNIGARSYITLPSKTTTFLQLLI